MLTVFRIANTPVAICARLRHRLRCLSGRGVFRTSVHTGYCHGGEESDSVVAVVYSYGKRADVGTFVRASHWTSEWAGTEQATLHHASNFYLFIECLVSLVKSFEDTQQTVHSVAAAALGTVLEVMIFSCAVFLTLDACPL